MSDDLGRKRDGEPPEVMGLYIEDPYGCFESEHADDASHPWVAARPASKASGESMFTFVPYTPAPPRPLPQEQGPERGSPSARRLVGDGRTAAVAALRRVSLPARRLRDGRLRGHLTNAVVVFVALSALTVLVGLPGGPVPDAAPPAGSAAVDAVPAPEPLVRVSPHDREPADLVPRPAARVGTPDDSPSERPFVVPQPAPPAVTAPVIEPAVRAPAARDATSGDARSAATGATDRGGSRNVAAAAAALVLPPPVDVQPAAVSDGRAADEAEPRGSAAPDVVPVASPAASGVASLAPTATERPTPPAAADLAAAPAAPVRSDRLIIQQVLEQYRDAFNALDPSAARAVWPTVDMRALGRAFDQLQTQEFALRACEIDVRGARAVASCAGTLRYVPKVGSRTARVERREWEFNLTATDDRWLIDRVVAR